MRIIKEEYHDELARRIQPAQFTVFPEEWLITAPEPEGDVYDDGGNGRAADEIPPLPAFDMAAVKKEAEQIIENGKHEAGQALAQAEDQARKMLEQADAQAQQMFATAQADGDAAKKEAFAAGFSSGEEGGFKKGFEDGYTKGKSAALDEASRSLTMIVKAVEALENYHTQVLTEAQQDIVKMAMTVAEKVLHKEIMTDPNTVISVVKNAISKVGFKRHFTIHVNPLDIDVLNSAGDEIAGLVDTMESVKFKPDPKVEAGGCVIQTESGVIDAQVDRQFSEIKASVMNAMQG